MENANPKRRNGFILVATLLVISLLTILVVSALVLSQVEIQANYNSSRSEVARQNALFGLSQALNQLQLAAGPDQRVTARADILNSVPLINPVPPTTFGYAANQPAIDSGQSYWTGVWKNTSNDFAGSAGNGLSASPNSVYGQKPGPGGSFLYYDCLPNGSVNNGSAMIANRASLYTRTNVAWLISWPLAAAPDPTASLASQGISQLIDVADNMNVSTSANPSLTASSNTSVLVPKVPILERAPGKNINQQVGSFAFWVSDEGVKAKANCPDPYLGETVTSPTSYVQAQSHFQISQSPAVNQALYGNSKFNAPSAIDIRGQSVMAPSLCSIAYADTTSNTSSWGDFGLHPGTYSSDFTVSSYGVIADNFNGGLRKDLTAAFENQNVYWSQFSDSSSGEAARKVFSLNAIDGNNFCGTLPSSNIVLDGMRWDSLYLYYNLYKSAMPSPISAWQGSNLGPKGIGSSFANGVTGASSSVPIVDERVYCEPTGGGQNLVIDPIFPSLVGMTWSVSVGMKQLTAPSAGNPGTYDLILCGSPKLVTFNPWNVDLQPQVMTNGNRSDLEYDSDPYGDMNLTTIFQVGTSGAPVTINNGGAIAYTDGMADAPLLPGEVRVYGIKSNLDEGTISSSNKTSVNINPEGNSLFSNGYEDGNYLYQQVQVGLQSSNPSTDELYFMGGNSTRLSFPNVYVNAWNVSGWPNQALGTSSGIGLGQPGPVTNIFPSTLTPIDNIQNLVSDTANSSSFTPKLIAQFIDREPGISGTGSGAGIAMPNFAAGGGWYNPTNLDCNRASRDYYGSGTISTLPSSTSDIQTVENGAYSDTGWEPTSVGRSSQNTQLPMREMPHGPLISMGQFKNMACHYYCQNSFSLNEFSFYPVGGSYQSSLGPNNTYGQFAWWSWSSVPVFDDNFLANEVLFDGYFLSTVPPASFNTGDSANWPITGFNQPYIDQNRSLPNSRLVYYHRGQSNASGFQGNPSSTGTNAPNISDLQPSNVSNANLRKPAANLLLNGAFNINSTSVPAWESVLSSTSGAQNLNVFRFLGASLPSTGSLASYSQSLSSSTVPFLNFTNPLSISGTCLPNTPWFGLVTLNNTMIAKLASNIVQQIQARGPFLSLGDFLNRRLYSTNTPMSSSGALQSAIDATGFNDSVSGSSGAQGVSQSGFSQVQSNWQVYLTYPYPSAVQFPVQAPSAPAQSGTTTTGNGVPGTLLQNDLVQVLAPTIASRSDTFIIRTYGEAVNPNTGVIEAQAWAEATVQRFPEYFYSSENGASAPNGNCAYDDPSPNVLNKPSGTQGLSAINCKLGRRFKIISMRWLNKNEL